MTAGFERRERQAPSQRSRREVDALVIALAAVALAALALVLLLVTGLSGAS